MGNDDGNFALAFLPLSTSLQLKVKFNSGVVLPFAMALSNNWDFGSQIVAALEQNQLLNGVYMNYPASAKILHLLFEKFDVFTEVSASRESKLKILGIS